jgi:hypothetical protein
VPLPAQPPLRIVEVPRDGCRRAASSTCQGDDDGGGGGGGGVGGGSVRPTLKGVVVTAGGRRAEQRRQRGVGCHTTRGTDAVAAKVPQLSVHHSSLAGPAHPQDYTSLIPASHRASLAHDERLLLLLRAESCRSAATTAFYSLLPASIRTLEAVTRGGEAGR